MLSASLRAILASLIAWYARRSAASPFFSASAVFAASRLDTAIAKASAASDGASASRAAATAAAASAIAVSTAAGSISPSFPPHPAKPNETRSKPMSKFLRNTELPLGDKAMNCFILGLLLNVFIQ